MYWSISVQIWQAIQWPFVAHPLYRRCVLWHKSFAPKQPGVGSQIRAHYERNEEWWLVSIVGLIVALAFLLGLTPLLLVAVGLLALRLFILYPLAALFGGTVYGLTTANHISDAIAVEKQQGRHIFLSLTPYGSAGTAWAICGIVLHTHSTLRALRANLLYMFVVCVGWLGFAGLALLVLSLAAQRLLIPVYGLLLLLDLWVVAVLILMDFAQSTVIGCLVGMIAPELTNNQFDTRQYATGLFLTLQISAYLVVIFLSLLFWGYVYRPMQWPLAPTFPMLILALIYLCREIISFGLWLLLARCTNSQLADLHLVSRVDMQR